MSDADPGTFDKSAQDPAQAGKDLQDPTDMSTEQPQSDDGTEAAKIGEAINGFTGLYPRQTSQEWFTVLSTRNSKSGSPITAYRVNILELECLKADGDQCPDQAFNLSEDTSEVCDHLAAAIYQAPAHVDMDALAMDGALSILQQAQSAADAAHNTAKVLERAQSSNAAQSAQSASQNGQETDDRPSKEDLQRPPDVDPAEKANELQEAFDEVLQDMQTRPAAGRVWIQTGKDTPDTLPGPGNVEVFNALLKDPEQVEFIHDDHNLDSERPGKWWKNAIKPADVDSYISEVLQ